MCKTYDAIYELARHVESNILICCLRHTKIEGELYRCCENEDCKCYDGVVTLKDAIVTCHATGAQKQFKWLNVAPKSIEAFAFKCCEM